MERVFVALGSNINAERNLPEAVRRLAARGRVLAVSPVYQTRPVGRTDQADFLNGAVLIETALSPAQLKTQLQAIERALGRHRTADRNAPRTIDLDISIFGDCILDIAARHIPDPDILIHAYLARPLADLDPERRHPETHQTLLEIAERLPVDGLRRRPDVILRSE